MSAVDAWVGILIMLVGALLGAGATNAIWLHTFRKHARRQDETRVAVAESYERQIKAMREISDGVCEVLRERNR